MSGHSSGFHNRSMPSFKIWEATVPDALAISRILWETNKRAGDWPIIAPAVVEENWIQAHTEIAQLYAALPHALSIVVEDGEGEVTGVAIGRLLAPGLAGVKGRIVVVGMNDEENDKCDNSDFKTAYTAKYGRVFYVTYFAVDPQKQGCGIGKALMSHIINHCKRHSLNIILASTAEAVNFYRGFGFVEITPPRMVANGTVQGTNQMLLELYLAGNPVTE